VSKAVVAGISVVCLMSPHNMIMPDSLTAVPIVEAIDKLMVYYGVDFRRYAVVYVYRARI
jgi:hypothetical protein